MITMLILSVGIMGAYQVATQGNNLERMTENRTKAIAFAREGLEATENIRDTNWLKFSTNYANCFDVLNYDINCTNPTALVVRINDGSYVVTQDSSLIWRLNPVAGVPISETSIGADRETYMNRFPLLLDADGKSTQTGATNLPKCRNDLQINCNTNFTREIRITRPGTLGVLNPIQVKSIVTWMDGKQPKPYVIEMEYTLQNWKNTFYNVPTP